MDEEKIAKIGWDLVKNRIEYKDVLKLVPGSEDFIKVAKTLRISENELKKFREILKKRYERTFLAQKNSALKNSIPPSER